MKLKEGKNIVFNGQHEDEVDKLKVKEMFDCLEVNRDKIKAFPRLGKS